LLRHQVFSTEHARTLPEIVCAGPDVLLSETLLADYRPNAGVVLFNREGAVWLGRRLADADPEDPEITSDTYRWQFPQGGIDAGETPAEAARRELKEETGFGGGRLLFMTPGWLAYDFPPETKPKKWRGQRQKYAVMLFDGVDGDFDLEADDHQEFEAWRWASLEETTKLIVPFKRAVYEELAVALMPLRDRIAEGTVCL